MRVWHTKLQQYALLMVRIVLAVGIVLGVGVLAQLVMQDTSLPWHIRGSQLQDQAEDSSTQAVQVSGEPDQTSGGGDQAVSDNAQESYGAAQEAANHVVVSTSDDGQLEKLSYTTFYQGSVYHKLAYVYVPYRRRLDAAHQDHQSLTGESQATEDRGQNIADGQDATARQNAMDGQSATVDTEGASSRPYNALYMMHGSGMNVCEFATELMPVLDELSRTSSDPALVVVPSYYPDESFVADDYVLDAPLTEFFATTELTRDLMPAVTSAYTVYDETNTDMPARHRAFGGFSMGSVTTWYVMEKHATLFGSYMPVASDVWITGADAEEGGSEAAIQVLGALNYQRVEPGTLQIFAGAGSDDEEYERMAPQIAALRQSTIFSDKTLQFVEVPGYDHDPEVVALLLRRWYTQLFVN